MDNRVLVVDDEQVILDVLWENLSGRGYECTVASHANEALSLLRDGNFALLLTDIVMPDVSGPELAESAREICPDIRVIGVESSGAPAMKRSVEAGERITLTEVDCVIDGLTVKRVGEHTHSVVSRFVDEIVTLPDAQIFDALLWLMTRAKLVAEGAAAAPVGALLQGLVEAPAGTKVVCVISGGNLDVEKLRGLSWN